jgi:intracellular septation protein A
VQLRPHRITLSPPAEFPPLLSLIRRAVPNVVEGTLIPAVLFYVGWRLFGRWGAFSVALLWSYSMLLRHRLRHSRVPGLLVITSIGLTVRTVVAIASDSTFIYFIQPVAGTLVIGIAFGISVLVGRPLVDMMAGDFVPVTADLFGRARVRRLFRRLTWWWAGVNIVNAGVSLWLLLTLPTTTFIALKPFTGLVITMSGVVITVAWSLHVARQENMHYCWRRAPAVAAGGASAVAT